MLYLALEKLLRATNDGDDLSPSQLQLAEDATNNLLTRTGWTRFFEMVQDICGLPDIGSYPQENVRTSIDVSGHF